MNEGSLRWGISYSALLWTVAAPAVPVYAAPKETVLYNFRGGSDGASPTGSLIGINAAGVLYGTTMEGGGKGCGGTGCGTVFELEPPAKGTTKWTETVLHRFHDGADGALPLAGLLADKTGALYGTTTQGGGGACYSYSYFQYLPNDEVWRQLGKIGCGTVFKLTPPPKGKSVWTESILHAFQGIDGRYPAGIPVMDKTGALYGLTNLGGSGLSEYTAYLRSLPYSFCSNPPSLNCPAPNHYYVQYRVGSGTVFKLTPPSSGTVWTETVLHSFQGGADGAVAAQTGHAYPPSLSTRIVPRTQTPTRPAR